jgi:hypothetical protein
MTVPNDTPADPFDRGDVSVTLPTIPVTEGRGAATERVAAAGGCNGGRGDGG